MVACFMIDVSKLPTHKERYDVLQLFENDYSWEDVRPNWHNIDALHKTFDKIHVTWVASAEPKLPDLPPLVKVHRQ